MLKLVYLVFQGVIKRVEILFIEDNCVHFHWVFPTDRVYLYHGAYYVSSHLDGTTDRCHGKFNSITEESDSVDKTILTISGRKTKVDEL